MKPRDTWTVGASWDNADAIRYWRDAYASMDALPRRPIGKSIELTELVDHCRLYQRRTFTKNSKWLVRLAASVPGVGAFQQLVIRLTDLNTTVRFSFFDDLREAPGAAQADVEMASENLDFIFLNEFGYDTLTVNGRFEASTEGFGRMTKNFAIGSLNALGLSIRPSLMVNADVVLLLLNKLRSFVRKMEKTGAVAQSGG